MQERRSTEQKSIHGLAEGRTTRQSARYRTVIATLALIASAPSAAVNLAWDPVDDPRVAVYEVWYGTASTQYTHNQATTETRATVDGLDPGQDYFFSVRACDAERLQCSDYSNEVRTSSPNNPPVAQDDTAIVAEDSSDNVLHVLGNDGDPDGQALTVSGASATHGSVTVNSNGTLGYSPSANFNGSDSLSYTVSDGAGGTASATVTVSVTPVNDAPLAGNDHATVFEDSTANTLDVLSNDSDVDGDSLAVTGASASYGTVRIDTDGTLSYSPSPNFNGSDTLAYSVSDGAGGTDTAIVAISVTAVNDPPQASDDSATVTEDSSGNTLVVLANDSDPDGQALTVTAASAANGSVSVNSDGTLDYDPAANFNGSDSLSYTVSDGNGGSDSATVTVSVTAVNDPPQAVDDSATVPAGSSDNTLVVLANDSDVDGDALTVTAATAAQGSVSINTDGTLGYSPAADFVGSDTLSYTISDGDGASASASVTVDVTPTDDPPVAGFVVSTTTGEAPLTVLFSDSSTGEITSCVWHFGDGSSEIDATQVTHTYTTPGTYTVSLTVSGPGGTDEQVSVDLIVVEGPPDDPAPVAEPFDLSGDGKADIVLRHTKNGKLHLLEMSHNQILASGDIDSLDKRWQVVGMGDFGGDGVGDLLLRHANSGELELWEMQDGYPLPNPVPEVPGLDWEVVGIADFGGDGRADILLQHGPTGQLELWEMDANLNTSSGVAMLDPGWRVTGIGDFGGDGQADILLRDDTGSLVLWEMDANLPIQSEIGTLDPAWQVAGVADFGGDGRADILLLHRDSGELELWEMDAYLPTPSTIGFIDPGWNIVQISDFGDDERADILFRDTSNGILQLFEMDGKLVSHSEMSHVNRNYRIQPGEE